MTMQITVQGVREAIAKIQEYQQNLVSAMPQVVQEAAFTIESEAKLLCPVDTGRLRTSIHTEVVDANTMTVSDLVDYGIFVEFGTLHQAPQPFLGPAADLGKQKFKELIVSNIQSI